MSPRFGVVSDTTADRPVYLVRRFGAQVFASQGLQDRRDCVVDPGGCTQASVDVVGCLPRCTEETGGVTLRGSKEHFFITAPQEQGR